MANVSAASLEIAGRSKAEFAAVFASASPPDVSALTGFEFRGYNQPRAAALLVAVSWSAHWQRADTPELDGPVPGLAYEYGVSVSYRTDPDGTGYLATVHLRAGQSTP